MKVIPYHIHRFPSHPPPPHKGERIIQGIYLGLGMRWVRLRKSLRDTLGYFLELHPLP